MVEFKLVFPGVTVESPPVPFDLTRMLFGDAPPLFLLEIALRTVVITPTPFCC